MSSRTRSRNAWESQLSNIVTSGASSFDVDDATGLIAPVYLVIAPTDATKREYIKVGTINTNTLSSVTRDLDGSANGGPFEHAAGTKVRAIPTHQHLDDLFDDIETLETDTHSEDHAARHASGGADPLSHDVLADVSADDHHAEDHAARHMPGGADPFIVEVDNHIEVAGPVGLTTTPASIAQLTLTIPGAWNTWTLTAWGTAWATSGSGPVNMYLRMNNTNSQILESDVSGGGMLVVGGRVTGNAETGNRFVNIFAEHVGSAVNLIDIYLYARAVRTG